MNEVAETKTKGKHLGFRKANTIINHLTAQEAARTIGFHVVCDLVNVTKSSVII